MFYKQIFYTQCWALTLRVSRKEPNKSPLAGIQAIVLAPFLIGIVLIAFQGILMLIVNNTTQAFVATPYVLLY